MKLFVWSENTYFKMAIPIIFNNLNSKAEFLDFELDFDVDNFKRESLVLIHLDRFCTPPLDKFIKLSGLVNFLILNECGFKIEKVIPVASQSVYNFNMGIRELKTAVSEAKRDKYTIASKVNTLTVKETFVLREILQGHNIKEVADKINVAEKTVYSIKYNILRKFGAKRMYDLCMLFRQSFDRNYLEVDAKSATDAITSTKNSSGLTS